MLFRSEIALFCAGVFAETSAVLASEIALSTAFLKSELINRIFVARSLSVFSKASRSFLKRSMRSLYVSICGVGEGDGVESANALGAGSTSAVIRQSAAISFLTAPW